MLQHATWPPRRAQVKHCKLLSISVLITLSLTIMVSLSQRLHNQQLQLTQASQMVAHGLTRTLENTETILLSLAEALDSSAIPDLERLQQRMYHAVRFSNQIARIVLINEQHNIILDSEHNRLAGKSIPAIEPEDSVPHNAGMQIGGKLPSLLVEPRSSGPLISMHLHIPAPQGEQHYTLLLAFNAQSIIELYESSPTSMAGRYALIRSDGAVLINRTAETQWPTQVQQLYSSENDSLLLRQWSGPVPTQLSHIQLSDRYPLAVVRNLDYPCSLSGWIQQNRWLVGLLLLSLVMAVIASLRQRNATTDNSDQVLADSIYQWPQPLLLLDSELAIQYSNAMTQQHWPQLCPGQKLQPCNNQGEPILAQQLLTSLASDGQWLGALQLASDTHSPTQNTATQISSLIYSPKDDSNGRQHLIVLPALESSPALAPGYG